MKWKICAYFCALASMLLVFCLQFRTGASGGIFFERARAADESSARGGIRPQKDSVGYAVSQKDLECLVRLLDSLEADRFAANEKAFPSMKDKPMLGAIIPHDDYLYAGRGYVHAIRSIDASCAVLFGVSHTARRRGVQGKLIFDTFDSWRVAGRECPISTLREDILNALPEDLILVSDEMHSEEHSLEGFVPLLQHFVPDIEIIPILVTRFEGERFDIAADTLASVISKIVEKRGLRIGNDVVFLISADCVHYGDEQWGGRNYAPFGVDSIGYKRAVAQDLDVIERSLTGKIDHGKVSLFRELVDSGDFKQPYKITWCGVYSIPFGLSVLERVCSRLGQAAPTGFMLVYGTSLERPELELEGTALGTTAIATLRHWVGYTAIGYW